MACHDRKIWNSFNTFYLAIKKTRKDDYPPCVDVTIINGQVMHEAPSLTKWEWIPFNPV